MTKSIISNIAIATILVSSTLVADNDAKGLFEAKCKMCHIDTRPTNRADLVAPPAMGVMRHVKMRYPKKEDAVGFMVDYVLNPTKEKSVCMPQKIARFGLMPSQKSNVTEEELKKISEWMFDNFPPAGFMGGMGRGAGMGMMRGQ